MTYKHYEITAFTEADLLTGNDKSLGCGDSFTMPGSATTCITVKDNDAFLSGDSKRNEHSDDKHGQTASITGENGDELGNSGQIYAEFYYWVCDTEGNWYVMIEIEQEGSNDDFYTFYTGSGYEVPPEGAELTIYSRCDVKGNWLDYKCLDAGDKEEKDPWSFDEETCTYTIEAECWDLHNFKVVDGDQASGGELVKIAAHDGKISTVFGGETGVYNMTICAQDETDGVSKLMIYVNGEFQQTIKLDQQSDGGGSNNGGFSEFTLNGLEIAEGDKVEIRAWKDNCEFVRIDAIKFEQVKFEECDLPGAVKLDFEGFEAGDILTDLDGLTISATGGSGDAMIFDSQNPTGGDGDLETQVAQLGNVLIVSEDGDTSDPDDVVGGTITFDFDNPSTIFDLKFIDTEEGGTVTLTLADNSTVTFDVPELVNGGVGQLVMNVENVVSMEVALDGSGAIDDLCWVPGEPPLGSLSGRYFCDVDRDDVDLNNGDEPGVEGIIVYLLDANGVRTGAQTTTDSDGNYSFEGLEAGTYGVEFVDENNVNVGKSLVAPNDPDGNGDDTNDSDAIGDATNSTIEGIVVVAGEDTPDNDAGVEALPGSLSGRYFCDVDRDDVDLNNGDEPGVEGITVYLLDANGERTGAQTTTDSDGNYSFGGLDAGTYGVEFVDENNVNVGKSLVAPNDPDGNGDDTNDSDAIGDATNSTIEGIVVVAGEDTPDNDAGVEALPGSLSGRYFCDDDRDGLDNDGPNGTASAGIAGVMVMLLDAGGNAAVDIDGNPVAAIMTDSNGDYSFGNLAAGSYSVKFTDAVSGKTLTTQNADGDVSDDIDSDAGDLGGGMSQIDGIVVVAGQNTPDNDAGVFPNAAPDVEPDEAMTCADEEVTVDLSDNYSDSDSDSVSITMLGGLNIADGETIELSGTADDGTVDGFDFTGLSVTRDGDSFIFDGEDAFASLGFNDAADVSIEFKVEDSDGATNTANIDLTFKGYASEETIAELVEGSTVTYTIDQGANFGEFVDAYTLEILSSSNGSVPLGSYTAAYCIDGFQPISPDILTTGNVLLATEANAAAVGSSGYNADNIDLVNWLLNNDQTLVDNGDGTNDTYTDLEVQEAIWTLLNGDNFVINEFNFLETIDNNNGVRDGLEIGTIENINEIVQIAQASGEGFVAKDGDIFGLIIDPTAPDQQEQPFIIGVQYECIC